MERLLAAPPGGLHAMNRRTDVGVCVCVAATYICPASTQDHDVVKITKQEDQDVGHLSAQVERCVEVAIAGHQGQ